MNHLPFIAGAYALGAGVPLALAVDAWMRLRTASRKLAAIDTRRGTAASESRRGGTAA